MGKKLVPIKMGINPSHGSANSGFRESTGKDIPTVAGYLKVLLTAGDNIAAVRRGRNARIGANRRLSVHQEFVFGGGPVSIEETRIDINTGRVRRGLKNTMIATGVAIGDQELSIDVSAALLFRNPNDHKSAGVQRRHGWGALVERSKLVDQELWAKLLASSGKDLSIDILEASRILLVKTAPNDSNVAVCQDSESRVDPGMGGGSIDEQVTCQPCVAGGQEARIDILEPLPASLPDKDRPSIVEKSHLRTFLITDFILVHSKSRLDLGQIAVKSDRIDIQAIASSGIVLPNQEAAGRSHCKFRPHLSPSQCSCYGKFIPAT